MSISVGVKRETLQRITAPTAILVGLPEGLYPVAHDVLVAAGMRVLRVGHPAGAAERIPVVMPGLVVLMTGVRDEELELVVDRCIAVGADTLSIAEDEADLETKLADAGRQAFIRALKRGF